MAELENRATSEIPAQHGRSVNITGAVRLQIGIGVFAVILVKTKDNIRRCCVGCGQREDKNRTCGKGSDPEMSEGFHGIIIPTAADRRVKHNPFYPCDPWLNS